MIHRRHARRGLAVAVTVATLTLTLTLALTACFSFGPDGSSSDDPDRPDDATSPTVTLTEDVLLGTWGSTDDQEPYLTFTDDGSYSGSDGCNRVSGSWELEDGTVTIVDMLQTQIGCPDLTVWLGDAHSLVLADGEDDELIVRNRSGDEIGTLDRDD